MGEPTTVPEGFEQLPSGLGFNDVLQPVYQRLRDGELSMGMVVLQSHCNMMGICHGGVLMTLADLAAASAIHHQRGELSPCPTINMSVDFISPGELGAWLAVSFEQVTVKRRFGFSSGVITSDADIVARFNGTFYLPGHKGVMKPDSPLSKLMSQ